MERYPEGAEPPGQSIKADTNHVIQGGFTKSATA